MTTKELFIQLTDEMLSGQNPNRRVVSKEDMRVLNYINGIRALNKQESKLNEKEFFLALHSLYKNTVIPLLKFSTSTLLFKKFNQNRAFFDYLNVVANELENNVITQNQLFWELFIESLVLGNHNEIKLLKPRVEVFVKFAKTIFDVSNLDQFGITFKFILNHCDYNIYKSLRNYQIGINTLGYQITDWRLKKLSPLFKILHLLKKKKVEPNVIEYLFILFANKELVNFAYEKTFLDFLRFLLDAFPPYFLLDLNRNDFSKLNHIFKLNRSWFLNFDYSSIIKYHSSSLPNYLRDRIVREVLRNYGISFFFIQNFNNDKLEEIELTWFNDVVSGKNLVYSENLPIKLSKKLVHKINTVSNEWLVEATEKEYKYFTDWLPTIADLTVTEGLLWSAIIYEVKNVPFTNEVVNNIRGTENATFWVKTMIQLYRNGLLEDDPINQIMDYIQYQVFTLNRNINFKTKKAENIITESNEWHAAFGNAKYGRPQHLIKLPESTIEQFYFEEDDNQYVIKQLLTNKELFQEGNELNHCVGSYTDSCLFRGTFIFSLRHLNEFKNEKRLITIEIYKNRIFQKRGNYNRACFPFEDKIIAAWAKENKIGY
jgi:hypothetical protein